MSGVRTFGGELKPPLDENLLEHFGVRGMHWGQRKAQKAEKKWEKNAGSQKTFIKVHNAAADEMNRVHIDRINNMPKYKNVDFTKPKNKALNDQYMKEYEKTWNSVLAKHSQAIAGTSPGGKRFVLSQDPKTGDFNGHVIENVTHASAPNVKFVTDATGHVTEVKIDALVQNSESIDDVIEHFGVRGMRWGVRKTEGAPGVHPRVDKVARKDAHEFARAKMFYGQGAGTRRKLIKAKVEANKKSPHLPGYSKAFDHHLARQDMGEHASKAQSERTRKNTTETGKKTTLTILRRVTGEAGSVAAVTVAVGSIGAAYLMTPHGQRTFETLVKNIPH